ncbi:MAG: alkane 1-monooxygenase [Proteobacteria bacterium]|nr:alkane 1-monooxygenase [Pseudomonadota bacterium]
MTATAPSPAADTTTLSNWRVASIWSRHLLSLWFPLNALAFVATGPHSWATAPLFLVPILAAHWLDSRERVEKRQPDPELPAWPFDLLVYVLAALQLINVVLLVRLLSGQPIWAADFTLGVIVVGASSGFSIITAHELIHRRPAAEQWLGRALLCTVLYEHFYTEHLRGHHVRIGTESDPATARFGETFHQFYRRTVPAQFRSAWRLECKRLGDEEMPLLDRRQWRNRVLHGLVVGWGGALCVALTCGVVALAVFVLQALLASRLLEIVNYFEHWGLSRQSQRVRPTDSWDTHSWFTYYALVGLSRHADHHAYAARPYQQLRVFEEPPVLPRGYIGMIPLVVIHNSEFRALAAEELERRRLGPFATAQPSG